MKKVAVISGGSGYIGSTIQAALASSGFEVVDLSRNGRYVCDVRDADAVQKVFAEIKSRVGHIDACIHAAAAALSRKNILMLSAEEFEEQIDIAAIGAFNLFKEAVPLMKHGTLIGITSQAIELQRPIGAVGAYIAAKYALRGLLRTLSSQVPDGIRVYAIAPGFLPGGLNADMPAPARDLIYSKLESKTSPEEIARLVVALATGTSSFESGQSILMPGGIATPL